MKKTKRKKRQNDGIWAVFLAIGITIIAISLLTLFYHLEDTNTIHSLCEAVDYQHDECKCYRPYVLCNASRMDVTLLWFYGGLMFIFAFFLTGRQG